MNQRLKYVIIFIIVLLLITGFGFVVAPPIVQALPGEMRVRIAQLPLGSTLLEMGRTPMPTALPVPANANRQTQIIIPTISPTAEPTATETVRPTQ
ncbi:MAG: hypothetical protein KDE51_19695, partial [Anaerolineales bacterium]|nr:hypothetical protein [Anaerolineales bacterium]